MVPVREQVGMSTVPGVVPNLFNKPASPGAAFLTRALQGMMTELLWWTTLLTPARERDQLRQR